MTYVALALVGLLVVTVVGFANLLRAQQRAHTRERDLLLNQLLNTVGKPWLPAPADDRAPDQPPAEWEPRATRFTESPEHFPSTYPE